MSQHSCKATCVPMVSGPSKHCNKRRRPSRGVLLGDSSCQYGWHVLSTTVSETVKQVRPCFGWHVSPMYPPSCKERLTEGAQGLSVHCFCFCFGFGCSSCLHCTKLHLLQGQQTPPLLYVCSVRFTAPTLCSLHVQRPCGRPPEPCSLL